MFFKTKSPETIKKNVWKAGIQEGECHGDVRRAVYMEFKNNGIIPTKEMNNKMSEVVCDVWQNSETKKHSQSRLWSYWYQKLQMHVFFVYIKIFE